jgi:hypothetical protein
MLAVEAPVKKLVAVGGVALAIVAGLALRSHAEHRHWHHQHTVHRLTLHAPIEASAIYYTVFANGDVFVRDLQHGQGNKPLQFRARVETPDSCYWEVTETMTPVDARHYSYDYDEQPAGCDPDALPSYIATPRTGEVVVDEVANDRQNR